MKTLSITGFGKIQAEIPTPQLITKVVPPPYFSCNAARSSHLIQLSLQI